MSPASHTPHTVETLLIALASAVAFIVAYNTYGKWLGARIFRLVADRPTPAHALRDGIDYVPTHKGVVFGHHFTSIAGTGPIVGPAIAILWGWLPALLWVVFGSIFIGAVHDFGALVVSLRNRGETIGETAGRLIHPRVRILFLSILAVSLTIVLAIFGMVIGSVFRQFPTANMPCLIQIPLAMGIGYWMHRRQGGLLIPSLVTLALMYVSVVYADWGPFHAINQSLAAWSNFTWVVVLLLYSYAASVLPVWLLLQPRDYINSLQLISVLGLLVVGLVVAAFAGGAPLADGTRPALELAAPAIQWDPVGAPALFPFLFITVACGAISGFHCLVSSGTSSKQLNSEPEARLVGYGCMLTEGFLAVLVLLVCGSAITLGVSSNGQIVTGAEAWAARYSAWNAGLGVTIGTFVEGSANLLRTLGLSATVGIALMGVFVASFAATTLDTACRLQRYVLQELISGGSKENLGPVRRVLSSDHGATLLAIGVACLMAAVPLGGKEWSLANAGSGGVILWPLFGATNQLLGGLSFLVIAFYLWRRSLPIGFLILPTLIMLVMPLWAMLSQAFFSDGTRTSWLASGDYLLVGLALVTCALEVWMIVEAIRLFPRARGLLEDGADSAEGKARA